MPDSDTPLAAQKGSTRGPHAAAYMDIHSSSQRSARRTCTHASVPQRPTDPHQTIRSALAHRVHRAVLKCCVSVKARTRTRMRLCTHRNSTSLRTTPFPCALASRLVELGRRRAQAEPACAGYRNADEVPARRVVQKGRQSVSTARAPRGQRSPVRCWTQGEPRILCCSAQAKVAGQGTPCSSPLLLLCVHAPHMTDKKTNAATLTTAPPMIIASGPAPPRESAGVCTRVASCAARRRCAGSASSEQPARVSGPAGRTSGRSLTRVASEAVVVGPGVAGLELPRPPQRPAVPGAGSGGRQGTTVGSSGGNPSRAGLSYRYCVLVQAQPPGLCPAVCAGRREGYGVFAVCDRPSLCCLLASSRRPTPPRPPPVGYAVNVVHRVEAGLEVGCPIDLERCGDRASNTRCLRATLLALAPPPLGSPS